MAVALVAEAGPMEGVPVAAVVSRTAAHAAAETSASKAADAPPVALAAVSAEEVLTVASVILRAAEASTPKAEEALTVARMEDVTQAVEE